MKTLPVVAATVVDWETTLTVADLARACGVEVAWVVQLVEVGVVSDQTGEPALWRFCSADLRRARQAMLLQRDFESSLDAAALTLDLMDEVRRLKSRLRCLGIEDA